MTVQCNGNATLMLMLAQAIIEMEISFTAIIYPRSYRIPALNECHARYYSPYMHAIRSIGLGPKPIRPFPNVIIKLRVVPLLPIPIHIFGPNTEK